MVFFYTYVFFSFIFTVCYCYCFWLLIYQLMVIIHYYFTSFIYFLIISCSYSSYKLCYSDTLFHTLQFIFSFFCILFKLFSIPSTFSFFPVNTYINDKEGTGMEREGKRMESGRKREGKNKKWRWWEGWEEQVRG